LNIQAIIKTGSLYEPADQVGLASMTGSVMRTGGTTNITGDELDERLAFLGGSISTSIRSRSGNASLSVLAKDTDEGLKLFADVLMHPAFAEEKIQLYKDQAIDGIKNRNDSPRSVLDIEFNKLLYGKHPHARLTSKASIEGITRKDLLLFHKTYYASNNIILAVAGDFNKKDMLAKLEKVFTDWPQKKIKFPAIPKVKTRNKPGVYMIQKDINQGYVNIGHFGTRSQNPDIYAINVMNFILGGGSFTSRIVTKVRSDEGLAYSTGSRFSNQEDYPGTFYGYVQTKSTTVHYAISLIMSEFKRIRTTTVTDEEMETAKKYYLDSFPSRFSTSLGTMNSFANLEFNGYPMDYYKNYRQKINRVTKAEVKRVARKYIKPAEMAVMVVGDVETCKAGYDKHPGTLAELGKISIIELKDPLTGM